VKGAALGLALVLLAACQVDSSALVKQATKDPGRGGSVVEALVGTVATLNPLFQPEDNSRDIDSLIYQGLTTVGPEQDVVPQLARSWTVSKDQLTYTVDLRDDVSWSDGKPFNSADVLFTYKLLQDPTYQQLEPSAKFWSDVKVDAPNGLQVRFTLKAPSASFPLALRTGILAEHVFGDVPVSEIPTDAHSAAGAVGTGPFVPESMTQDGKVVTLKRNPHARPQPKLDHFIFRTYPTLGDALAAVSSGEADTVGGVQPPQLDLIARRPDLRVLETKSFSVAGVLINLSPDQAIYFNPTSVRQALNQAIDREKIVESVLRGHADVGAGPIPPSEWAYSARATAAYQYDPKAAGAALDAAGWTLNPQTGIRNRAGKDFSINLVVAEAYPYQDVADMLAAQLRQVGVDVRIDREPASLMVGLIVDKRYQLALAAFDNGSDPDQYTLWHSGAGPASLNFAGMPRQALIDKDLEDGRSAADRSARMQAYEDFQKLIDDAAPAIFLYEPHYAYVVARRVQGVRVNAAIEPADRFQYVTDWYVTTKGT
jgi:peptide/nickel transport system substrate-binding protein